MNDVDVMKQKYKVQRINVIKNLVDPDPENLSSIDNPDVASIPQTSEQYCREGSNISAEELEHISNPTQLASL